MRMRMEHFTREIGWMISKKALEWSHGQMELNTKANIVKVKSMGEENLHLLMEVFMKESFWGMRFVAEGNTIGQMGNSMTANGNRTKCME